MPSLRRSFWHFQVESAAEIFAGQRSRLSLADSRSPTARILLFFLSATLVSCPHPPLSLSLSRFSPSLFLCEESREERQIRLLPQKLPITAWQRVQHCCLANAEFVNPGSTPANVGAPFCSCRFKWVERRAAATYRHNSGISHELRGGYSWFFFFHWNEWDQRESICDSEAHLIWTVLHFLSTCTYKVCMLIWSLEWWIFSTENSLQ